MSSNHTSHPLQNSSSFSLSTMEWKRGPIIGRGSSAAVYTATTAAGDLLAVKSTNLSTSAFLQKEQQFLSKLTSKHIIKYMGFDINYHNNKPTYNLLMEFAAGGTISDEMKKHGGSLDESMIRSYTHQVLLGLDHVHSNKIVHCDIKCSNLLICKEGVKIGDFGCAKSVEFAGKETPATTWEFSGTPVFMAPEVARGEEQSFPADIWALGCSVIEMATGSNPWPDLTDPVSGLYKIGFSGELPEFPAWLPESGKDFLGKCLDLDVKKRWTIKELLQHPFVSDLNSDSETRKSPTSTLDYGFWESLSVPESSLPATGFSGESPTERVSRLVDEISSGFPNWENDDWITVRSNAVNETRVYDGDSGSSDSFSFSSLDVEEEQEVERLVRDEDIEGLEYSNVVSRFLDYDRVNNYDFSEIKELFRLLCV